MLNLEDLRRLLDLKDKQLAECTKVMLATTHVIDAVLEEIEEGGDASGVSVRTEQALRGAKFVLLATRAGK